LGEMGVEELGAGEVEVVEGEGGGEGEAEVGVGDNFWGGGEGEEGGTGFFGEGAEAVPGAGGDALEFAEGVELEVEEDEGEVAVAEEEVGGFDGLDGVVAADPEKMVKGAMRLRVERIVAIDQSKRAAAPRWALVVRPWRA
jgi:hypothetical protein